VKTKKGKSLSLFVVYDLHLGKHHTMYFPNEQEVMLIPLLELKTTKSLSLFVVYDLHLGKHHTLYFPNEQEVIIFHGGGRQTFWFLHDISAFLSTVFHCDITLITINYMHHEFL
jgi:hypothetical protein